MWASKLPPKGGTPKLSHQFPQFFFTQNSGRLLRSIVDAIDPVLARFNAATFKPENHIGFAAHWTNLDDLLQTEQASRHARINQIGEFRIALAIALDHGRRVHARRGAESVFAKHRIIKWNRPTTSVSSFVAVLTQAAQVVIDPAEQLQIHQQLVHRRVADTLAHAER